MMKILMGLVAAVILFLGFVATRESHFKYERSGVIKAPAEKIFPFISNFKLGEQWSPYQKIDPTMKLTFSGTDGQVGSVMEFDGNKDVGAGKLEILNLVPQQQVQIRLTMLKPFHAENLVQYQLNPEDGGTRFTWTMTGDGGFFGKFLNVFIDCEKMVGGQFEQGINNLKVLVESQK